MGKRAVFDLREKPEQTFVQQSAGYLAIVDLESYPPFLSPEADHLDLLGHLCLQADACTAAMWEVPDKPLRVQMVLAENYLSGEQLAASGHHVFSNGWVRTTGTLALANRETLLTSAREERHGLLAVGEQPGREADVRSLLVPSGLYAVTVFSGKIHGEASSAEGAEPEADYIVVLRFYPHPPPRLAPVRLRGLLSSEL